MCAPRSGATRPAARSPAGRASSRTRPSRARSGADAAAVDEQVLLGDRLEPDPLQDRPRHLPGADDQRWGPAADGLVPAGPDERAERAATAVVRPGHGSREEAG